MILFVSYLFFFSSFFTAFAFTTLPFLIVIVLFDFILFSLSHSFLQINPRSFHRETRARLHSFPPSTYFDSPSTKTA